MDNIELLNYIYRTTGDPYAADQLCYYLKKEFPQLNHETRLQFVDKAMYFVYEIGQLSPVYPVSKTRPKQGSKARLWRVVGELFNREDWIDKGKIAYITAPEACTRQIEFKHYGVRFNDAKRDLPYQYNFFSIYAGYDPISDTLYIRR